MKITWQRIVHALNDRFGFEVVTTHFYVLSLLESANPILDSVPIIGDCEVLDPSQVDRLARAGGVRNVDLEKRLQRGDKCYFVQRDGRILHFSWAQFNGIHPVNPAAQAVAMRPKQVCIYHCYTDAAARGLGLYPNTLRQILQESAADGCTLGWIYTTGDNTSSQRGIAKAGFRWIHSVRAIRLGRFWHPLSRISESLLSSGADLDRGGTV